MAPALARNRVVEVQEAGLDYVTCTARPIEKRLALLDLAQAIADREWRFHGPVKEFSWQGYQMRQTGGVQYGEREDSAMVRVSGEVARHFGVECVKRATNVSRLDLQVTCKFDPPVADLGRAAFRAASRHWRTHARAPKPYVYASPDGVETVELGSRSSDYYARIYDKALESGEERYRGAWRFELEIKGKTSSLVARTVAHDEHPERAAIALVSEHCERSGIRPAPFRSDGGLRRPSQARQTTDDRRVGWLGTQCQPVIAGLNARGRWLDAYAALGMVNVYTFTRKKADGGQQ